MTHVTVIVPVYNAGAYLEPCLRSIREQTDRFLQILVIDDGSTDSSGAVCDRHAEEDSRIVVLHQANQGKASVLDTGFRMAEGEYISIIDSDDWIEGDYYEQLYRKAQSEELDLIIADYCTEPGHRRCRANYQADSVMNGESLVRSNPRIHTTYDASFSCRMLFSTRFVRENNLFFRKDIVIGEDTEFNLRALSRARRVMYLPYAGYHYVLHEGSLVRKKYKPTLESDLRIQYETRSSLFPEDSAYRLDMAQYYVGQMFNTMLLNLKNDPRGFRRKDMKRLLRMPWLTDSYKELGWHFGSSTWKEWFLHVFRKLRLSIPLYYYYTRR